MQEAWPRATKSAMLWKILLYSVMKNMKLQINSEWQKQSKDLTDIKDHM